MKKLLSVVLALCMIASLCTVAITTVSAETETAPVISKTTDLLMYLNEEGTLNTGLTGPGNYFYDRLTSAKKSDDGNIVVVPKKDSRYRSTQLTKETNVGYLTFCDETAGTVTPVYITEGVEYQVVVRYKINSVSSDSTYGASVGIGYSNALQLNGSSSYVVAHSDLSKETTEWTELTATVTPTLDTTLRVLVSGVGCEIEIDYVELKSDMATIVEVGSIRHEKTAEENNGVYQSAGIRFKGRVSADFRAAATEIGFYAVPSSKLEGTTIVEYIATEDNFAIKAKVKGEGMDEILYAQSTDDYGRDYYDYQLIIVDLTREGYSVNLLDTDITCVMYAVIDGESVYTEAFTYCYNDVLNAQ